MRIAAKYLYLSGKDAPVMNGFVEVDDEGLILRTGIVPDPSEEDLWIDGAVVPGFVNAHCHLELSHLKGKFTRLSGMAGFIDQINSLRDSSSREDKIRCLENWMDRMWDSGVSAMADISNCDDSFAVKSTSPMYTRTFIELFGSEPEDCGAVMEGAYRLLEKARRSGIDASITPHSCYTMSPQLLCAAAKAGLGSGFLSYHSQESRQEEDMIRTGTGELADNRRRYGMSMPPVCGTSSLEYFLDTVGSPAPGEGPAPHLLLVHNICLSEEDAKAALAKFKNVYWAVCPMSNLFIHNALPPIGLMRRLGLKITVGTDSLSSNDDLDMVKEMYCLQSNFPEVSLGEILRWSTLNGAEFLGKENELGSIEAGKRPGLVALCELDSDGRLTASSYSERLV
ncbi:MAG: amidohydrolase family protein [Candidatus Cryptobacteroides sp.]